MQCPLKIAAGGLIYLSFPILKMTEMSKLFTSTAEAAGSDSRWCKWTAARHKVIKLEELVKFYTSLRRLGLAPCQEQKIASKITLRHLSGPSAVNEISEKLEEENVSEKCWRKAGDIALVNKATIRSLRGGLKKARKEAAICRGNFLGNVSGCVMGSLDRKVQAYSSKVRRELRNELSDKIEKIRNEKEDCANHHLCQWMRKRIENTKRDKESNVIEGPETESDFVRREMRDMIEEAIESDKETKKTEENVLSEKVVTIYGEVELSKAERKFLNLGPQFPLMEELKEEIAAQDFLTGLTKVRWGRMGKEPNEIVRYKDVQELEEEEKIDGIAFCETREFREEDRKVSLARKQCTNMKTNRRVFMPSPHQVKEECILQTREDAWMEEFRRYRN